MLTFRDLQEIGKLIDEKIDEQFKVAFRLLPTKEEFFSRMDALSKEIKDMREEFAAHSISHDRLDEKDEDLDGRVLVLEKKVGIHDRGN